MRRLARAVVAVGLAVGVLAAPASASPSGAGRVPDPGHGSPNMAPVTNLADHVDQGQRIRSGGSDIEFADLVVDGQTRRFALVGSLGRGLQIVDVSDPENPTRTAHLRCGIHQGDVQVWRRGGRTMASYTADYSVDTSTRCYDQLRQRGINPGNGLGTVIVNVTNPFRPRAVGFVPIGAGSHNQTVHPSGDYLYNSNSDFSGNGVIEVIKITDPTNPVRLADLPLTGGANSHDITFNDAGTRAYSAALNHSVVIDTTNPASPQVIGRIVDPAIQIHHQADPLTVTTPEGTEKTFLIVTDEVNGGGPAACPGGGLHVYDVTGPRETNPVKLGAWFISDDDPNDGQRGCTSHVLRMYPDQGIMTIAWYRKGVRVLDISGFAEGDPGPESPMRQIGWYEFDDTNAWSVKAPGFLPDGSFYMYSNDIGRGVDVYYFDAGLPESEDPGEWVQPDEALADAVAGGRLEPDAQASALSYCVIITG
ncbi:MAG: LVIVD repeat-containing protein [Acidimicrobiales bacterium]